MSNQVNSLKKGLTVKYLVTTGIFSAIFFVFTLIGGLPFAPNPVLTFYMPYHRSFHYPVNMDVDPGIVFFGGYGSVLQIRHNLERERQYIRQHPVAHRNEFKLLNEPLGTGNGKTR